MQHELREVRALSLADERSPVAGFELTGAVGEDPVRLLAEAFRRRKLPVQVKVLINDAPGVMAAGRYMNATTMIGVILGTGVVHTTPAPACCPAASSPPQGVGFLADAAVRLLRGIACHTPSVRHRQSCTVPQAPMPATRNRSAGSANCQMTTSREQTRCASTPSGVPSMRTACPS